MLTTIRNWLYNGEARALQELQTYDMATRNRMAAEAQSFADWLALENSRDINNDRQKAAA